MNDDLKQLKENEKKFENCLYLTLDNNNQIKTNTLNDFDKIKHAINQLISQKSNYIESIFVNNKDDSKLNEMEKNISCKFDYMGAFF